MQGVAEPLATVNDLETLLGRQLTEAEDARAPGLLNAASVKIRAYTRRVFSVVADDSIVLRPVGGVLRLPQKPVSVVTSVDAISGLPGVAPLALVGWVFDGIDKVSVRGYDRRVWVSFPEWFWEPGPDTYRVVYSHGYEAVPDAVNAVCVDMVLRSLTSPSLVGGMVAEHVGQYGYQLQQGSGAAGFGVSLSADNKADLAPFRTSATTVQLTQS